jgi:hypothetical protein
MNNGQVPEGRSRSGEERRGSALSSGSSSRRAHFSMPLVHGKTNGEEEEEGEGENEDAEEGDDEEEEEEEDINSFDEQDDEEEGRDEEADEAPSRVRARRPHGGGTVKLL